jgi:hypothetical protein
MSGKLVAGSGGVHTFQDDLESTIYVLLWLILLYSETSDRDQVLPFLSGVLDPQPRKTSGGHSKADFLQARTFLKDIRFPGRSALHCLIDELAYLLAVRYTKEPNEAQIAIASTLREAMKKDPDTFTAAYEDTYFCSYHRRMDALNHQYVIDRFEEALQKTTEWLENDNAVKQQFQTGTSFNHNLVTKTEWDTTLFVQETDTPDDMMVDEISDTSGSESSDQMIVASDDECVNSPALSEMSNADLMFRWIMSESSGPVSSKSSQKNDKA